MHALGELKRIEREKRDQDISTPRFHDLAEAVEDQARRVFRVASQETIDGNRAPTTDVSTNEVRPGTSLRTDSWAETEAQTDEAS